MSARDCRRCGHAASGHPPYLPGADWPGACGECRCWQYLRERPLVPLLRRLLGWPRPRHALGPVPSPEPEPEPEPQERPVPCPVPGPEVWNGLTLIDQRPFRAAPYVPGSRQEPGD